MLTLLLVGNLFSYLWNSSPQRKLKATKTRIEKHIQRFKDEVQAIHREEVRARYLRDVTQPPNRISTHECQKRKINAIEKFRNLDFYGREEEMTSIYKRFSPRNAAEPGNEERLNLKPTFCVIHGLPGVGKTQVALEYTHRFEDDYDALFWLPSEQEPQLANHVAGILRRLKNGDPDFGRIVGNEHDQLQPTEAVRNWLQYTSRP